MFARRIMGYVFAVSLALTCWIGVPADAAAQITRAGWTSLISASNGECADVAGMQTASGSVIVQWPCQDSVNEAWVVIRRANGFSLMGQQSQLCVSVSGKSVTLGACTATAALWQLALLGTATQSAGYAQQIVSSATGACLIPPGTTSGAALTTGSCSGTNGSAWTFKSGLVLPSQPAVFQAGHSGQCLSIAAQGTANAGKAVQTVCGGVPAEQWQMVPIGAGYVMALGQTGYCLTAASLSANATLSLTVCTGAANQSTLFSASGSAYLLSIGGYCLGVNGASTSPGAAVLLASCAQVPSQIWSMAFAATPANWTGVIPLTTDPIVAANLPNGQLLTWSTFDPYSYEGDVGTTPVTTYYSLFNPATLTSGAAQTSTAGTDMFCPGTANLADGRILANGGSSSSATTIYDPNYGTFSNVALMNIPRGYEGSVTLSNGSVFTLGGSWNNQPGGKSGEIWSLSSGWTLLPGISETPIVGPDPEGTYRGDNHLWLFAQSNGTVFQAGPSAQMHWITTTGQGSITSAGPRADDAYSMNGNAVMYDVGKILKAGGAPAYDEGIATSSAYQIALGSGVASVTKLAPMAYARSFASGVALPDGNVLISGGQAIGEPFTDSYAVLVPEIWDSRTAVFRQLPPMQTPRTYHSVAILLQDGRVFVGGGGQCGTGCAQNHFNTEILTPPYLLNMNGTAASRTTITSAPATAALGSLITVTTGRPVVSFALMRNSSITHTVNNEQRRIVLRPVASTPLASGSFYTLVLPADPGVAVPGYYTLFAIDPFGVPSAGVSVMIHP